MNRALSICLIACMFSFVPHDLKAQEENSEVYVQGKRYLELNIKAKEKYNKQASKRQERLLKKLKRKEGRFAKKLKRKDSASYQHYKDNPVSFDSISKVSKTKEGLSQARSFPDKSIDSLKNIKKFLEDKAHVTGEGRGKDNLLDGYDNKLGQIGKDKQNNEQVGGLIDKRMSFLKDLQRNGKSGKLKGLKGMEKQVFYSKGKLKALNDISEEPSKAEEKALEFLQGQEGFDDYLKDKTGIGNPNASIKDLEKMGYQTKRQMNEHMQKKFGKAMPEVQENISKQIEAFNDKAKSIKEAKGKLKSARSSVKKQRYNFNRPSFKINPMRSLPLSQRIEKEFNWQTVRPSAAGEPAKFQLAAMAAYKHTEKLKYGLGVATSIGLGQGWNDIRFSFEGLGLRTFSSWKLVYGFNAYAGYERMYKKAAFLYSKADVPAMNLKENDHNKRTYSEAVLIGLTKEYRISDKWNGSVQFLYDIWWKDKGLNSPIQIRFSTIKTK